MAWFYKPAPAQPTPVQPPQSNADTARIAELEAKTEAQAERIAQLEEKQCYRSGKAGPVGGMFEGAHSIGDEFRKNGDACFQAKNGEEMMNQIQGAEDFQYGMRDSCEEFRNLDVNKEVAKHKPEGLEAKSYVGAKSGSHMMQAFNDAEDMGKDGMEDACMQHNYTTTDIYTDGRAKMGALYNTTRDTGAAGMTHFRGSVTSAVDWTKSKCGIGAK